MGSWDKNEEWFIISSSRAFVWGMTQCSSMTSKNRHFRGVDPHLRGSNGVLRQKWRMIHNQLFKGFRLRYDSMFQHDLQKSPFWGVDPHFRGSKGVLRQKWRMIRNQLFKGFHLRYDIMFQQNLCFTHACIALAIAWKQESDVEILIVRIFSSRQPIELKFCSFS